MQNLAVQFVNLRRAHQLELAETISAALKVRDQHLRLKTVHITQLQSVKRLQKNRLQRSQRQLVNSQRAMHLVVKSLQVVTQF